MSAKWHLRWPRILLPPKPFVPPVIPEGMAWCCTCRGWRLVDVIPAIPASEVPAFPICTFCGNWLDLEEIA